MYKPNPKLLVKIPARRAALYVALQEELGLTSHNEILDLLLSWAATEEGGVWLREEVKRRVLAPSSPLAAWSSN